MDLNENAWLEVPNCPAHPLEDALLSPFDIDLNQVGFVGGLATPAIQRDCPNQLRASMLRSLQTVFQAAASSFEWCEAVVFLTDRGLDDNRAL